MAPSSRSQLNPHVLGRDVGGIGDYGAVFKYCSPLIEQGFCKMLGNGSGKAGAGSAVGGGSGCERALNAWKGGLRAGSIPG